MTRIARGDLVAHSVGGVRHVARVIQQGTVVGALCGVVLHGPRRSGLVGPECTICRTIAGRDQRMREEADL